MSEVARLAAWCFLGFITGILLGVDIVPKLLATMEPESGEYIVDDMEVAYLNGGKELIQGIAQVEIGEKFVLMFDRENNIRAIIPNEEVWHIKSIRKDVE